MTERIRITYRLHPRDDEAVEALARRIALEQTVELPDGCYPERIEREIVGRIDTVRPAGERAALATIEYPATALGADVPQLLNLLFGNVSFLSGVEIVDLELPSILDQALPGPRFGIEGLRAAVGVQDRALACTAAKPVGLTSSELAARCAAFTRGGIDVVKDDHSVTDQRSAPFRDRVERCQEAVRVANGTDGRTLYFPNVTAPFDEAMERAGFARSIGCRGVVVSPFLTGLDMLRWLAQESGLVVLAHPSGGGGVVRDGQGVAAEVMFGLLLRVCGADGVIFLNVGGRFPAEEAECLAIARRLREPGPRRPAMPVPGGGVAVDSVARWIRAYGRDVMLLIGGSLYAQGSLEPATRALMREIRKYGHA